MPVIVRCPNPKCGSPLSIADAVVAHGEAVRCGRCRTPFRPTSARTVAPTSAITPAGPDVTRQTVAAEGGEAVGRFRLRRELGAGSFGTVYLAHDTLLDREVALKLPHPGSIVGARAKERFLREARAAAQLRHPHIVPVYDAGEDGGRHYIASAFIAGRTLEAVIGEGPVDPRWAAHTVRDLAEALAYAHEQGIVHRDVKPGNVLVDEKGQAHLTDFGLAHRHEAGGRLTGDGAVLGTPLYMSPEQASGKNADPAPANDQYSLGVVLYELLCGQTPFSGPADLIYYHLTHTEPQSARQRNRRVPRDLEAVCVKALAKRPEGRYGSCGELADDLRRWLEGDPVRARPLPKAIRLMRWCRRNAAVAALVAGIAVLTVAAALVSGHFAVVAYHKAGEARAKAEEARQEQERAEREEGRANQKADEAQKEAERVRAAKLLADRNLYVAHINLAKREWDQGNVARVVELLDGQRPERTGGTNFRGWEWYYLSRLCRTELQTWQARIGPPIKEDFPAGLYRVIPGAVSFSPDGHLLAGAAWGRTVKVWDTDKGGELLTLKGHTAFVSGVSFSPDGRRLASAGADGALKVWDARTGQEVFSLPASGCVCYSSDGKRLAAAAGSGGGAKVWDATTGRELLTLAVHGQAVSSLAFSPDGKRLAVATTSSGEVTVWDAENGREVVRCKGHPTDAVLGVCYSPDGRRLASAAADRAVRVWDAETGGEVLTLRGHTDQVLSVCFSPDGQRLASSSRDRMVKVWDARTGDEILTFRGHAVGVNGVCFSPDGRRLASVSGFDGTVKVWDARGSQEGRTLPGRPYGAVLSLSFSADGQRLNSVGGTVQVWDASSGEEVPSFRWAGRAFSCACFSPDGTRLAAAVQGAPGVTVRETMTGRELLTLPGGPAERMMGAVCFSPDGQRLAIASKDKTVKVWDARTGREINSFDAGHPVYRLWFSPDGKQLAGADMGVLHVWEATTGREVITLAAAGKELPRCCFAPDGRHMAGPADSTTAKVWDARTGKEALVLGGHTGSVKDVCYSPDGKRLVTACSDGTVKVWDAETGQELLTFKGSQYEVYRVCFSPDGRRLASAGNDWTVRLWDATPRP
jgi:WD40 repeat protein/sRNA-binding protein